jgi:hypothetical protein
MIDLKVRVLFFELNFCFLAFRRFVENVEAANR